ncbi:type 1 glutamine amidotransferase [Defluviimonas sp. WL0002]|uniref:Type 1 glutamine amidotransferase n=1 Tax=Albidovulum marisflavi TaxID=2984159 RepID=A0ABT2Z7L1_9RHOB|nr:type 1 glutamine amidotransferase [Defluviimonas sp. WL0002]MCV2867128.1 type 1 glutamine amidotransferase [Defluviimonas sp. WL0002]
MTKITIVESNTPDLPAQSEGFAAALLAIDPALQIRVVEPYAGAAAAETFGDADGIVFTGSSVEWSTAAPEAEPLRVAMRAAFAAGRPVYGSCNGLQLAAVVLGGRVEASPNGREEGTARAIALTKAGRTHPMMAGRQDGYAALCIHRDEVSDLPPGAVLISGNAHSPVQAMVYEQDGVTFWGCQYHPEYTVEHLSDVLERLGRASGDCAALRASTTDAEAAARFGTTPAGLSHEVHRTELRNWLALVRDRKAK